MKDDYVSIHRDLLDDIKLYENLEPSSRLNLKFRNFIEIFKERNYDLYIIPVIIGLVVAFHFKITVIIFWSIFIPFYIFSTWRRDLDSELYIITTFILSIMFSLFFMVILSLSSGAKVSFSEENRLKVVKVTPDHLITLDENNITRIIRRGRVKCTSKYIFEYKKNIKSRYTSNTKIIYSCERKQ